MDLPLTLNIAAFVVLLVLLSRLGREKWSLSKKCSPAWS